MTQSERIISKFGGVDNLSKALALAGYTKDRTSIYRWKYAKAKNGTEGIIPSFCIPYVIDAARLEGILLTADDLDPRPEIKAVLL
jgi:hypothetical protein